jgi:hypothetical protein
LILIPLQVKQLSAVVSQVSQLSPQTSQSRTPGVGSNSPYGHSQYFEDPA